MSKFNRVNVSIFVAVLALIALMPLPFQNNQPIVIYLTPPPTRPVAWVAPRPTTGPKTCLVWGGVWVGPCK